MTFKEYVNRRRVTDTPTGDFTKDFRRDRRAPENFADSNELARYIGRRCWGDRDVIAAARSVYRGYLAYKKKKGGS